MVLGLKFQTEAITCSGAEISTIIPRGMRGGPPSPTPPLPPPPIIAQRRLLNYLMQKEGSQQTRPVPKPIVSSSED
jgi:hypothetical protein